MLLSSYVAGILLRCIYMKEIIGEMLCTTFNPQIKFIRLCIKPAGDSTMFTSDHPLKIARFPHDGV